MTGPEHYREAERRLTMAWEEDSTQKRSMQLVAEAQVHATLALAAATAHGTVPTTEADRRSWHLAIGDDDLDATSSVW